ncbi:MAG: hypothetical protein C0487_17455 [Leptothrix sp. (in: Bacteria)]|uniref:ProQ/FINO family protein n=1 Tax=Aquabacterium sp. CECT 9606 TaxID=2845822 RepID=UPI001E44ABB9|nr:ProQ/FinO family protein [Aquabacterium sp. CECT 9606]MBA4111369.1 hypothetical protein [Leptothrix sp. (in: b-proteobacteria)]
MSSTPTSPSPTPDAMTPAACATQLRQLFPALFDGAPKPLKLRIQADIQERAPGVFTKQVLSAFLRRHTGNHAYLVALSKATHRFDLDGQPGDEISEEHRKAALEELGRRRANHEAKIELEHQQRRNRATLLRDFQTTTLTPANFCALKGVPVEELDHLLELARKEAQEAPPQDRRPRPPQRRR